MHRLVQSQVQAARRGSQEEKVATKLFWQKKQLSSWIKWQEKQKWL